MSPERNDYEDDDEREELASRSIFAAGWFRAVLVLTVLAIVVVVSLPYLLNWFEPSPPPARVAKPAEAPRPSPGAAPPSPVAPTVAPSPPAAAPPGAAATPPSAPKPAPASPAAASKPAAEKPAPPAAPKAAADTPAAARPAKPADKAAAPAGAAKVTASAGKPAAAAKDGGAQAGARGYWVQLGVFKDASNAESLAKTVRQQGFPVEVARVSREGNGGQEPAPRHEILVTEGGVEKVNAALKGKGSAQPVAGGVLVKPSFSLQEAMAVSKQLSGEGLKVVIRPAAGPARGTYHLVRAGGYADRARALAARDQIKNKGHEGFLTQGPAK